MCRCNPEAKIAEYAGIVCGNRYLSRKVFTPSEAVCMNFLSHFYFERYSRDPELVLGSVLPDLLRNADRGTTLQPQRWEEMFDNHPKLQSLYRGWMRHMETDRLFHNSTFFYGHTHELKVLLMPALDGLPIRPSFLSHIGLELLLDHLLLRDHLVHESDFYGYLAAADRDALIRFFQLCGIADTVFFFRSFNSFMRAQYVGTYRELDQVTEAMLSVCFRLWNVQPEQEVKDRISTVLRGYVDGLGEGYLRIFDEIRLRLS